MPRRCWRPTLVHPGFIAEMACLDTKTGVSRQKLAKRNQITRIQSFLEDLDTLRQMSKLSNGDIDINDEQEMWATILFLVHDLDIENPRHVIAVAHLVISIFPAGEGLGRTER